MGLSQVGWELSWSLTSGMGVEWVPDTRTGSSGGSLTGGLGGAVQDAGGLGGGVQVR